jgi:hypothetical protein
VSTEPRLRLANDVPGIRGALGHVPGAIEALTAVQTVIWDPDALVEPHVKEISRLRNARVTDCGY